MATYQSIETSLPLLDSELETIESTVDDYGANNRIVQAVQRLREALDALKESVEAEEYALEF